MNMKLCDNLKSILLVSDEDVTDIIFPPKNEFRGFKETKVNSAVRKKI